MNEKLNIETCTTAAESPFSIGTVEHYNLIVVEAMENIKRSEIWARHSHNLVC